MKLKILNENQINIAVKELKNGGVVVFPTETVFGLGANALNPKAVEKIFKVKGRPSDNPLIVHVNNIEMANKVAFVNKTAEKLFKKFSPGPLTLILKKRSIVPNITSANLNTVAVRIPNNKIALKLIELSNLPIAAPSANLSGKPSPTKIEHIINDLGNKINYALNGEISIGVESTVLDLTEKTPKILRYGSITYEDLMEVINLEPITVKVDNKNKNNKEKEIIKVAKSPGMKYTHYSPDTPLILATGTNEEIINKINNKINDLNYNEICIITTIENKNKYPNNIKKIIIGSRNNLKEISKNLYNVLREIDKHNVKIALIEGFNKKGLGLAIMDKLEKASKEII